MAIGANSYGSVAEVAALTPHYATATGNTFDADTTPTLTQVEKFIDRVSAILNVLLAEAGFSVAVSQADAKLALDQFTVMQAAHLVEFANGAGPFISGGEEMRYTTPTRVILRDAELFIEKHAAGFEALGAARTRHLTDGLECRTEDDAGDAIEPVFQRKMMGNVVVDWDEE
jgi:hypothetical protein